MYCRGCCSVMLLPLLDDKDGTSGIVHDAIPYTLEQKSLGASQSARPHDDEVI